MAHISEVTLSDFQKAMTPSNLMSIQLVCIALALGIFFFAGVVLFLSISFSNIDARPDTSIVRMLSYIHVMTGIVLYSLSKRLYNNTVGSKRIMDRAVSDPSGQQTRFTPAEMFFQSIRAASIIRLALMESVALFGLVICLLAALWGVLPLHPVYWLNTLSSFIFIAHVIRTFPTKERLEGVFREKRSGSGGS